LPSSCERNDVFKIAESARENVIGEEVMLKDVRIPSSDGFSLWKDSTFITMLSVTIVVAIFIAWGTAYDLVLRKRAKAKKYSKDVNSDSSGLNCTTYDLTRAITDKKNNCVGIGIPTGVNNNNSDENLAMENNAADDDKLCESLFFCQSSEDDFLRILEQFNDPNFFFSSVTRRASSLILSRHQFQSHLRQCGWK
jgi:hypothetical protein